MSNRIFKITPKVIRSTGLKSFVRRMCTQSPTTSQTTEKLVCSTCRETACSTCGKTLGWWEGYTEAQRTIITCSMAIVSAETYCSLMDDKKAGWPKLKKRLSGKPYLESSAGLKSFVRGMCTQSPTAEKVCSKCLQTVELCSKCHQTVGWWDGFTDYQKTIITCSMAIVFVGIKCSVLEEKEAGLPKLKKRLSGKPYLESWLLPWLTTKSTE